MIFLEKKPHPGATGRRRAGGVRWLLLCLFSWLPVLNAQDPELFPRPPELESAVQFWIRVYTEVDTRSGFLHDSQNLAVVYTRLPNNRREIEAARNRIRDDLRVLAGGKRDSLTRGQRDILDLWGEQVSNRTLGTAASNVRWQLGQSDRFAGGLRRSGAYRAHINEVIREKNLPIELGVLPHVESSFNPGAYSSAAAAGMWQFGRATGQRFMRIDHIVDERMDPYTATYAAMSLLEYNYSVLGTWPLALTAYNHGAGGITRAVRQTGTTDIETIVANYRGRAFGFASRNFYAQFLAVLDVENNARRHFGDLRLNPAPDFREVEADAYIDAEVFARSIGVSLEQLQADNPALRPVVWEGNKRIPMGFPIKVRSGDVGSADLLARVPADFKFAVQTPDIAYVVERGDSLSVIARRFNTSVSRLVSLNQLASRHRIQIGQRLLLPQDNINPDQLVSGASPVSIPADGSYTVRRGDTVSLIAARFGVTEQALLGGNGIRDRNRIYPGQRITLPGFENAGRQVAAVDGELTPTPPTEGQFAAEVAVAASEPVAVTEATSGQPEAAGRQPEAAGGQPGAAGGQPEAAGGQPEAAGGQPEVAGGQPEIAGGQPEVAGGQPEVAGGQPGVAGEVRTEAVAEVDGAESAVAVIEEPAPQLALNEAAEEILPPAAVLPDNVELELPVTPEEEAAVALDPALDASESNEQLTESLSADPSDYTVAGNRTIEIQASETLGHYADWLDIRAWDIRRLNNLAFRDPVIIGERLRLDFSRVDSGEFERRRRDFHSGLQQEFFSNYRIRNVEPYRVRRGDNVGRIARNRYSTPVWLLRQYNPELDFNRIQIDQEIVFPILERVN